MRELNEYEKDILSEYMQDRLDSVKAYWIRETLDDEPESPYDLYKGYKEFAEIARDRHGQNIKPGTYDTMRRYVWMLKKLGLIEVVRKEESKRGGFDKNIYSVTKYSSMHWDNPQEALYGG